MSSTDPLRVVYVDDCSATDTDEISLSDHNHPPETLRRVADGERAGTYRCIGEQNAGRWVYVRDPS